MAVNVSQCDYSAGELTSRQQQSVITGKSFFILERLQEFHLYLICTNLRMNGSAIVLFSLLRKRMRFECVPHEDWAF